MRHTVNTQGFTLLEMLIAVVVLSIALGASLEALSGFASTQAKLQERYCGHLVVWKDAIYALSDEKFDPQSGFSEECGTEWRISVEEEEIRTHISGIPKPDPKYVPAILPITITIHYFDSYSPVAEDSNNSTASLYTVRIKK